MMMMMIVMIVMIMMMIHHVLYKKKHALQLILPYPVCPSGKKSILRTDNSLTGHLGHRIDVEIEDRAIWAW